MTEYLLELDSKLNTELSFPWKELARLNKVRQNPEMYHYLGTKTSGHFFWGTS